MKRPLIALLAFGTVACSHSVPSPPQPVAPRSLTEAHPSRNWSKAPGDALDAGFATDVHTILRSGGSDAALAALREEGYDCIFGEAHEDYPEPAARCSRSFATRACQLDWVVYLSTYPALPGEIDAFETRFRRDCLGTADDWPVPVSSAIDGQLAPRRQFLPKITPE